jgi:hypothetical protein
MNCAAQGIDHVKASGTAPDSTKRIDALELFETAQAHAAQPNAIGAKEQEP